MSSYLIRRLMQLIPVLLIASLGSFALLHFIPGDPIAQMLGDDATLEDIMAVRARYGLDKPFLTQYLLWLTRILQGDLGYSYISGASVRDLIFDRLPATAELTFFTLFLVIFIGIPLGIIAAVNSGNIIDYSITSSTSIIMSMPGFWRGILLILIFSTTLRWLPPSGRIPFFMNPIVAIRFLILPVVTFSLGHIASITRFSRFATLDVLQEDYLRTARAKGLTNMQVIINHALRNAALPILTVLGINFGHMFAGAVIIEVVFAWPGIGSLLIDSIKYRDYMIVQGILIFVVFIFVIVNLLVDLIYSWLNPKIVYN